MVDAIQKLADNNTWTSCMSLRLACNELYVAKDLLLWVNTGQLKLSLGRIYSFKASMSHVATKCQYMVDCYKYITKATNCNSLSLSCNNCVQAQVTVIVK